MGDSVVQKPRPKRLANYNPQHKIELVDGSPFQYKVGRTLTDKPWALLCIVSFVIFFSLGASLKAASKSAMHSSAAFGAGGGSAYFQSLGGAAVQAAEEYATCMLDNFNVNVMANNTDGRARHLLAFGVPPAGDSRRLSSDDRVVLEHHQRLLKDMVESGWTIWDLFQDKIEIPISIMLSCAAIGAIWVFLLRIAATPVVWATLGVKIALAIYIGSLCADIGASDVAGFFYFVAAAGILWCATNTGKIRMAATLISNSALALQRNPSLFISCLIVYVPYLIYVAVWMVFVSTVPLVWEWFPTKQCDIPIGETVAVCVDHCKWRVQPWAENAKNFLTFHFYFTTALVAQIRLCMVAGTIGTWYFSQTKDKPLVVTAYWLRTALTTSLGSLSVGATIGAICDYIMHRASKWCWCCDPFAVMCRVIMCCLRSVIKALTRMCTVVHVFTNQPFCSCKDVTMAVLKRNFVGGIATETISAMVMWLASFVFASAMTFTTWYIYEEAYDNFDLLGPNTDPSEERAEIYLWVFLVLFCVMNSTITVFVIAMFIADWFTGCVGTCATGGFPIIIPLAAIFVGSVSHMVFNYILGIMMDSTSAMLICTAVDIDNGTTSHDNEEMVRTLQTLPCVYATEGGQELQKRTSKHIV